LAHAKQAVAQCHTVYPANQYGNQLQFNNFHDRLKKTEEALRFEIGDKTSKPRLNS